MALAHCVIVAIATIRMDQPGFDGRAQFLALRNNAAINGLINLCEIGPAFLSQANRSPAKQRVCATFVLIAQQNIV